LDFNTAFARTWHSVAVLTAGGTTSRGVPRKTRISRIDADRASTHGRLATADGAYTLNRRIVMNEELMLVDLGDATEETRGKVGPERDSFQLPDIEPLG
jgi:hypothetical protein